MNHAEIWAKITASLEERSRRQVTASSNAEMAADVANARKALEEFKASDLSRASYREFDAKVPTKKWMDRAYALADTSVERIRLLDQMGYPDLCNIWAEGYDLYMKNKFPDYEPGPNPSDAAKAVALTGDATPTQENRQLAEDFKKIREL